MAAEPIDFDNLKRRFGLMRQEVYTLALMEALALKFNHQPRHVAPGVWEIDSRSEPGKQRRVTLEGQRLFCNCPAALGDAEQERQPRICTHTASVHLFICKQMGRVPLVRPMPPEVLRYDPSPEAKAALKLIERPHPAKGQSTPPAVQESALATTV